MQNAMEESWTRYSLRTQPNWGHVSLAGIVPYGWRGSYSWDHELKLRTKSVYDLHYTSKFAIVNQHRCVLKGMPVLRALAAFTYEMRCIQCTYLNVKSRRRRRANQLMACRIFEYNSPIVRRFAAVQKLNAGSHHGECWPSSALRSIAVRRGRVEIAVLLNSFPLLAWIEMVNCQSAARCMLQRIRTPVVEVF